MAARNVDLTQINAFTRAVQRANFDDFFGLLELYIKAYVLPVCVSLTPRRTGRMRASWYVRRTGQSTITVGTNPTIAPYAAAVNYRRDSPNGGKPVLDTILNSDRVTAALNFAIDAAFAEFLRPIT